MTNPEFDYYSQVFKASPTWIGFRKRHQGEAAKISAYFSEVAAGGTPTPPKLASIDGSSLVGMIDALLNPPTSQADPLSAQKMQAWPFAMPTFFSADVAVTSGLYAYAVQGPSTFDAVVYGPQSLQVGASDDHHLVLQDTLHGRETDFYNPTINGHTIVASGGCSFPIDADQEPVPGNANAARFPLARGLVAPVDIARGVINHPLVISLPRAVIGGTCVYPANQAQPPNPTGPFALGQKFQLPANFTPSGLSKLETMIAVALRDHGAYLRDISEGMVTIYGEDMVNYGSNAAAWGAVGVTLGTTNASGYPFATKLLGIPWNFLQVMQPPTSSPW